MKTSSSRRVTVSSLTIISLAWFALCPIARAVVPPPDGGYANFTTAEGTKALQSLTTGTGNSGLGWYALFSDTTGSFNTAIGAGSLVLNNEDSNTAVGTAALLLNTSGEENTAIGASTLVYNDTGNRNTAVGAFTLTNNIGGAANTAVGRGALSSNTDGAGNTAIGAGALVQNLFGSANTAVGNLALANNNVVGNLADSNTAVGALALFNNTDGYQNTAVGDSALASNQIGYANVAVGAGALQSNVNGPYNTMIGFWAGHDIDGTDNIYIGEFTGVGITSENATTRIGSHQDHCYIDGIYLEQPDPNANQPVMVAPNGHLVTPASSERFKEKIQPMNDASEAILALKPVAFQYKADATHAPQFGLIAEEVAHVNAALVVYDKNGKPYSVRYDQVNAMLLNEFLKEHRTVQELKKELATLTATVKQQAERLEKVSADVEMSKVAVNVARTSR